MEKIAESRSFSVPTTSASSMITVDYASIRGKTILISPTEEQYELLKKRLQERINDSRGETIYDIGIGEGKLLKTLFFVIEKQFENRFFFSISDGGDNGLDPEEYAASLATLQSLAATLDAECVELRQRKSEKGMTGQYLVRKMVEQSDFMEIRLDQFFTKNLSMYSLELTEAHFMITLRQAKKFLCHKRSQV